MVHATMAVAQDLDLDVARAHDHLFKVAFAVAKGGFGLAAALRVLFPPTRPLP